MPYIIAKKFGQPGSVVLRCSRKKNLTSYYKEFTQVAGDSDVQIVAVSRPSAYKEYAPFTRVSKKQELSASIKKYMK